MSVLAPGFALLDGPDALAAAWREQDLFMGVGMDALFVTVGAPDPAALAGVGLRFEAATGRALPSLLVELIARQDGYDLVESRGGRSVRELGVVADSQGCAGGRELDTTTDSEHGGLRIGRV